MSLRIGDKVRVKAVTRKYVVWYSHECPNELDPEIPIHDSVAAIGTKNWKPDPLSEPLEGVVCGKKYLPKGFYLDGGACLVQTGSVPVYLVAVDMKTQVMARVQDTEWPL